MPATSPASNRKNPTRSGSGPIASTDRLDDPGLSTDAASLARGESGLRRLLPALADVGIEAGWGGS